MVSKRLAPTIRDRGPNPSAVGEVAAEHLGPILYALELSATTMAKAGRSEEADYYRRLAEQLATAGGTPPDVQEGLGQQTSP